jgi:thiamine-phosphate pyrophosphorylase
MRRPWLYYITDRTAFAGSEAVKKRLLLDRITEAARFGVDFIQLREKDLAPGELEELSLAAVQAVQAGAKMSSVEVSSVSRTRLLINARLDVALACGADGVHLPANDVSAAECRRIVKLRNPSFLIGVSCHQLEGVIQAEKYGADFVVFGPVFEKKNSPTSQPTGLIELERVCRQKIPVLALGGVTLQNASQCIQTGAAGIAAIRLFQDGMTADLISALRKSLEL